MSLASCVRRVVVRHGGVRKTAAAVGIDAEYLFSLWRGDKDEPSCEVLAKLGIKRDVIYTVPRTAAEKAKA